MGISKCVVVVIVAIGALSGCGSQRVNATASSRPTTASISQDFDHSARQIAQHWPQTNLAKAWTTGFVPLQALTVAPPSSEFTEATQAAFRQHFLSFPAVLPPTPGGPGHVTFPDGSSLSVPLESAQAMRGQVSLANHAPVCTPTAKIDDTGCSLTVTRVRLGTTILLTSRGEARVPAWLLTTKQLADPIARVAVPLSAMTTELTDSYRPPAPNGVDWPDSLQSVDGARLTFTLFTGSCDTDIKPIAYETPTVVVIGATRAPYLGNCDLVGHIIPASMTLAAPLANRALLNIFTGLPVMLGVGFHQVLS